MLISDSVAPEDPVLDRFLNDVELLRDRSHVRNYRGSEWTQMLVDAGFAPELIERRTLNLDGAEWVKRIGTPPRDVARLEQLFLRADAGIRAAFHVSDDPWGFTLPLAFFRGTKM